jgi:hypothetical protein
MDIRLVEYMGRPDGWGRVLGQRVQEALRSQIESKPDEVMIRISLDGVERTDISFPREAVIELARNYRGQRGFCLTDAVDQDLLDNWDAAATKLKQPLFVWNDGVCFRQLGPEPSVGLREMLDYVNHVPVARTSEAATALHLKVPNASNKLKQLWLEGYILRREQSANSGGVEYEYVRMA